MTTAHRPTFDPARGKDAQRGVAYHQRLLPAHKTLKFRQAGQGTTTENGARDLRAELLRAERIHFAKKEGRELSPEEDDNVLLSINDTPATDITSRGVKRNAQGGDKANGDEADQEEAEEDYETKRRRVLEETRAIDADSESGSDNSENDDDDDDSSSDEESEDEEADLMRELAKIKAERAEQAAKEAADRAAKEEEQKEFDIARGNPLLNPKDYNMKRRWDDDVVFKNQARGTEEKKGKEFVNDLLRSDFHRRFMSKYVR